MQMQAPRRSARQGDNSLNVETDDPTLTAIGVFVNGPSLM